MSDDTTHGLFIKVGEDDPFECLEITVQVEDGGGKLGVGSLEAKPGTYELRRVDDGE